MTRDALVTTTRQILSRAGLKPSLIDVMEANREACAEPCIYCGAGAGRWCADRVVRHRGNGRSTAA